MEIVLIHGPRACGKTYWGETFLGTYGCDYLFDEESPAKLLKQLSGEPKPNRVLALCRTGATEKWVRLFPDARVITFSEAKNRTKENPNAHS